METESIKKEQNKLINDDKTIQNELENEICAKHSILTRLEAENETVRREFADLKLNYDSLQDDHQILNDVHSTLEYQKNENEEKMMALNKELNDLNDKIKAELKCKEDIIDNLQNEASQRTLNKDEMVKSLNMKNENLLRKINEINGEMDGIKESLKESENERLRKQIEIDSLRQKMEKIDGQLTDYKTVHNELENKYRANIVKYKKLENNYNEIQTKLNDKNMDLQRLLEQNKSIEREFELFQNESSLQIKSMNDTMHKLQNEMNENQKNYDLNKKEMISCHQTEIEKKEKCIISMKEEMLNEINKFNIEKLRNSEKHQTEINELNDNLMELKKEKTAIKDEYDIILKKYENEKCKLSEKEQTLQLLQKQLSRFDDDDDIDNDSISNPIESRMSAIFEQLNNSQNKLNEEIEGYKLKIIEIEKKRKATKESFESYKQTMSEQLDTAQQDIQIRQERSERLFKTFEQRLELRQKQNSEYKEKINELSNNIKSKKTEIEKHKMEIVEIKDQLKRCHQTINNAQTLNETLLHEKSQFDDKLSEITKQRNKLVVDITECMDQRENAIKTSHRMRIAEEKAHDEMMEYKTKYNELQELHSKASKEINHLKQKMEKLMTANSKLAGHHNAGQRINHLLSIKKECEKLKKEKKHYLNKISSLQKKLGNITKINQNQSNLNNLNLSTVSSINMANCNFMDVDIAESSNELKKKYKILSNKIKNISQSLDITNNAVQKKHDDDDNNQHLMLLNTIQKKMNHQNNEITKLKRDIDALQSDIKIREEKIKLLQDHIVLSPTISKKTHSHSNNKKYDNDNIKNMNNDHRSKSTTKTCNSFNFE